MGTVMPTTISQLSLEDEEKAAAEKAEAEKTQLTAAPAAQDKAPGAAAQTAKPSENKAGSDFAGLQGFVEANKEKAATMAGDLSKGIVQKQDAAIGAVQSATNDFSTDAAGNIIQDGGLLKRATTNAGALSSGDIKTIQDRMQGNYDGADAFTGTQAAADTKAAVDEAAALSGSVKTTTGQANLLDEWYKGGNRPATRGEQKFNRMTLGASDEAQGVFNNVASQGEALTGQFNNLAGAADKAATDAAGANATLGQTYSTSLGNAFTGLQTDINKRVTDKSKEDKAAYEAFVKEHAGQDVSAYTPLSVYDVMTKEDQASLNALAQILGQDVPWGKGTKRDEWTATDRAAVKPAATPTAAPTGESTGGTSGPTTDWVNGNTVASTAGIPSMDGNDVADAVNKTDYYVSNLTPGLGGTLPDSVAAPGAFVNNVLQDTVDLNTRGTSEIINVLDRNVNNSDEVVKVLNGLNNLQDQAQNSVLGGVKTVTDQLDKPITGLLGGNLNPNDFVASVGGSSPAVPSVSIPKVNMPTTNEAIAGLQSWGTPAATLPTVEVPKVDPAAEAAKEKADKEAKAAAKKAKEKAEAAKKKAKEEAKAAAKKAKEKAEAAKAKAKKLAEKAKKEATRVAAAAAAAAEEAARQAAEAAQPVIDAVDDAGTEVGNYLTGRKKLW